MCEETGSRFESAFWTFLGIGEPDFDACAAARLRIDYEWPAKTLRQPLDDGQADAVTTALALPASEWLENFADVLG